MTTRHADQTDIDTLTLQLGRPVRGVRAVACRCAPGHPAVVETEPRLPDGTPFPTLFYLTCPHAVAEVSTLESRGVMRELSAELDADDGLAAGYRAAHHDYLDRRERVAVVDEIRGVSAGGMPTRVKCLHVLVAHSLAAGPGVNPLGDRALDLLAPVWRPATCTWEPR
ncbi:hypothetical protein CLV30_105273 [Haloactinopolyspora alba]|uniref:DUF501 domain-containing protein n=1 Tax=Haloactinopolyspora alba TaxID=648780 RepID=A0A2P8E5Q4_9ACTN|nr:DUF501 domain-containing protein [Haloactinopolyspora alba]PSL04806.1 hypothetical protein CLV30_105273 [Haloactinopolyspora alba]